MDVSLLQNTTDVNLLDLATNSQSNNNNSQSGVSPSEMYCAVPVPVPFLCGCCQAAGSTTQIHQQQLQTTATVDSNTAKCLQARQLTLAGLGHIPRNSIYTWYIYAYPGTLPLILHDVQLQAARQIPAAPAHHSISTLQLA